MVAGPPENQPLPALDGSAYRPEASAISVCVASDRRMFAEALAHTLGSHGFLVSVTPASAPTGAAQDPTRHRLCLLDLGGQETLDLVRLRDLRTRLRASRVLVLAAAPTRQDVLAAFASGASGVVDTQQSADIICRALRAIAAGRRAVYVMPWRGAAAAELPARVALTRREQQVLEHIVAGHSARAVAADMGIAYATARAHIQNILHKLGAHSRLQAAALALERHLVDPPDTAPESPREREQIGFAADSCLRAPGSATQFQRQTG